MMPSNARANPAVQALGTSKGADERGPDVRLFGTFRLDIRDERLWREQVELPLRRKPFSILRHLTANPQRLVTQERLVEAVWGNVAMSESLLRTHIGELRRVLCEDIIETVVGRGYRFLLPVTDEKAELPSSFRLEKVPAATRIVGRDAELSILQSVFKSVLEGRREMVFVTGEPGVGKTTLTDAFLAGVAVPSGARIARGSCVEQLGAGEPYLPALDALGALCRGPDRERVVELLARHAPTWLAQMPGLVPDEDLQRLHLRVQGATDTRMLRELAEALDILAVERPLVLVLEDVQWADPSTVDLVTALGARREDARVLVITTCRPAELARGGGLVRTMAQLSAHRRARALRLRGWPMVSVEDYLTQRFAGHRLPGDLASTIHQMTGGNPLFTVAIVDDLESRRMIRSVEGVPRLAATVAEVARRRPDTVRQLIDIQIDHLKLSEQRILEAASTVGLQFAVGAVAAVLSLAEDDVEGLCEALANEGRFLRGVTTEAWPDGTIHCYFSFVHALYRDAALARVPAATARLWQRRVADGLRAAAEPPPRPDRAQQAPRHHAAPSKVAASPRAVAAVRDAEAEVA